MQKILVLVARNRGVIQTIHLTDDTAIPGIGDEVATGDRDDVLAKVLERRTEFHNDGYQEVIYLQLDC